MAQQQAEGPDVEHPLEACELTLQQSLCHCLGQDGLCYETL